MVQKVIKLDDSYDSSSIASNENVIIILKDQTKLSGKSKFICSNCTLDFILNNIIGSERHAVAELHRQTQSKTQYKNKKTFLAESISNQPDKILDGIIISDPTFENNNRNSILTGFDFLYIPKKLYETFFDNNHTSNQYNRIETNRHHKVSNKGRSLQQWTNPLNCTDTKPLENISESWDQFWANAAISGTHADFDESQYTSDLKLDQVPIDYKEMALSLNAESNHSEGITYSDEEDLFIKNNINHRDFDIRNRIRIPSDYHNKSHFKNVNYSGNRSAVMKRSNYEYPRNSYQYIPVYKDELLPENLSNTLKDSYVEGLKTSSQSISAKMKERNYLKSNILTDKLLDNKEIINNPDKLPEYRLSISNELASPTNFINKIRSVAANFDQSLIFCWSIFIDP